MIDFKTIQPGAKVEVVGAGAPGFAQLGDTLEITKVEPNKVWAKHVGDDDSEAAYFALSCGAARLELLTP